MDGSCTHVTSVRFLLVQSRMECHKQSGRVPVENQASTEVGTSRPARTVSRWTGSVTARFRTFRKHRRPCGQPAVVGEIGRCRPLPPQAGHFIRINATPSDFPFKSTGLATYPEPPQFGQSFGATPSPPRVNWIFTQTRRDFAKDCFALRIPNKSGKARPEPIWDDNWEGISHDPRNVLTTLVPARVGLATDGGLRITPGV